MVAEPVDVRGFTTAFGIAVYELRRERGMTQEALAFEADLHLTYISSIEREGRRVGLGAMLGLSRAFGITASELLARAERIERQQAG